MGVPALFRWLVGKYPKITRSVIEDLPNCQIGDENEYFRFFDFSPTNPNGIEVDNLYLDMNGIVHPCCHPEGKSAPKDEEEMMLEVFKYLDRIVTMVRPRKILYLAIDGVAPRAKMNQQRSRRFKAALDATKVKDPASSHSTPIQNNTSFVGDDQEIEEDSSVTQIFDSNCITPGTCFMAKLTDSLRYYIVDRIEHNIAWRYLRVILSDASVPGEGEHKIMEFIRKERLSPANNPNTQHVIYGLDADLIMLSLATHEPRFLVLREDVFFEESRRFNHCYLCKTKGHFSEDCPSISSSNGQRASIEEGDNSSLTLEGQQKSIVKDKPFIFLDISILREYLAAEFRADERLPNSVDIERLLDDWVFLCFFVGNDFLPHLPSMDIREGAIDLLVDLYKNNFIRMGGYITKDGHVYLDRVQILIEELGRVEQSIFVRRHDIEERKEAAKRRREAQQQTNISSPQIVTAARDSALTVVTSHDKADSNASQDRITPISNESNSSIDMQSPNLKRKFELFNENSSTNSLLSTAQQKSTQSSPVNQFPAEDDIRLWEPEGKLRYYQQKLKISLLADDENNPKKENCLSSSPLKDIVTSYVEGLCWVLAYYYQGCVSWKWFYPFHYAPLASDFIHIDRINVKFEKGTPFRAYDQLMSVLPIASKSLIPEPFHWLMTSDESSIKDFYPQEFSVDLNGKKHTWQGIVLLPFIDEGRLLTALETVYPNLSSQDFLRNQLGNDLLFVEGKTAYPVNCLIDVTCDSADGDGKREILPEIQLSGFLRSANKELFSKTTDNDGGNSQLLLKSPLIEKGLPDLAMNKCAVYIYEPVVIKDDFKFSAKLLKNVHIPAAVLTEEDILLVKSKNKSTASSYEFPRNRYNHQNYQPNRRPPSFQPTRRTY